MTEIIDRSWRDLCPSAAQLAGRPATVRIDTMRNRLAATRALLATVEDELEDLNVLAYDRARLTSERVQGGQPDYALDSHGDVRARDAYREIGAATIHALEVLADVHHAAAKLLRAGERGRNPKRMIDAVELAHAIEAQARRAALDQYVPERREAQPDAALAHQAVDQLVRERDRYKMLYERSQRREQGGRQRRRGWSRVRDQSG